MCAVEQQRSCNTCGATKPIGAFGRHKQSRGGYLARCKECESVSRRERRDPEKDRQRNIANYAANPQYYKDRAKAYRSANYEAVAAANRAYREAHPDAMREYRRKWHIVNRPLQRERQRARYQSQREAIRLYKRNWRLANPDKDAARKQRRRERIINAPVSDLTAVQWRAILEYFDYRCAYCLTHAKTLHQEHMTPLSRGGSHTAANVVPSCASCNQQKQTKTLLGWLAIDCLEVNDLPLFAGLSNEA